MCPECGLLSSSIESIVVSFPASNALYLPPILYHAYEGCCKLAGNKTSSLRQRTFMGLGHLYLDLRWNIWIFPFPVSRLAVSFEVPFLIFSCSPPLTMYRSLSNFTHVSFLEDLNWPAVHISHVQRNELKAFSLLWASL